jgi:hypothetical protein
MASFSGVGKSSVNKIGELREACTHTPPELNRHVRVIYPRKATDGPELGFFFEPTLPKATWSSASLKVTDCVSHRGHHQQQQATLKHTRIASCVY